MFVILREGAIDGLDFLLKIYYNIRGNITNNIMV